MQQPFNMPRPNGGMPPAAPYFPTPVPMMPPGMVPPGMVPPGMVPGTPMTPTPGFMPNFPVNPLPPGMTQPTQPLPGQPTVPPMPSGQIIPGTMAPQVSPFIEQSYIENVLRANIGKKITAFMSFDSEQQSFTGIIEAAARDHFVLSDPVTGKRYLLLMVYLDYITSDEELNYIQIPFPEQVRPVPVR